MAVSELTKSSTKSLSKFSPSELREELTKRLQNQEAIDNVKSLIEVLKPPKKRKKAENSAKNLRLKSTAYANK